MLFSIQSFSIMRKLDRNTKLMNRLNYSKQIIHILIANDFASTLAYRNLNVHIYLEIISYLANLLQFPLLCYTIRSTCGSSSLWNPIPSRTFQRWLPFQPNHNNSIAKDHQSHWKPQTQTLTFKLNSYRAKIDLERRKSTSNYI